MDHDFSHDVAQKTLRQRNLLAICCLGLTVIALGLAVAASTRSREVILQPVLPKEMVLSSSGVSQEYLEAVTRDAAQMALNRSPESLDYWMNSIISITAPEAQGPLKRDLMGIVDDQRGSQITQFVTINWIEAKPETLTSRVGAVVHTVVGSRDVRQEHKIFEFKWKYTGVSLRLIGFGAVARQKDEEA